MTLPGWAYFYLLVGDFIKFWTMIRDKIFVKAKAFHFSHKMVPLVMAPKNTATICVRRWIQFKKLKFVHQINLGRKLQKSTFDLAPRVWRCKSLFFYFEGSKKNVFSEVTLISNQSESNYQSSPKYSDALINFWAKKMLIKIQFFLSSNNRYKNTALLYLLFSATQYVTIFTYMGVRETEFWKPQLQQLRYAEQYLQNLFWNKKNDVPW